MGALYSLRAVGLLIALIIVVLALASQFGVLDSGGDGNDAFSDGDMDRFGDSLEERVGTDPLDDCADNPSDDAWPPDFNNDGSVTDFDVGVIEADNGKTVPPAPTRKDIAPDPPDGVVDVTDIGTVVGFLGLAC